MNDLNGLDWSSKPATGQKPNYNSNAFSTLRPTPPGSGRISPLPTSNSPNLNAKTPVSATDSFSNLVNFSTNNGTKHVSLQDQQKRLADLKSQQAAGASKALQDQYAGGDDQFWNNLGSGRSTPQIKTQVINEDNEDDFLAAFNQPQAVNTSATIKSLDSTNGNRIADDDDDPFGLSEFQAKQKRQVLQQSEPTLNDDDDVLGLLGKPVSERPLPQRDESPKVSISDAHPQDKAVAELVDMGFAAEKAKEALQSTESGVDVQAAVSWLLNQAHSEANDRSRSRARDRSGPHREPEYRAREESLPQRNSRSSTPSSDPARMASDLGTNFMKSAGSFWKQAKKQAQQAMQDLNSDSDSNQPKWMRNSQTETIPSKAPSQPLRSRRRPSLDSKQQNDVTDEVMMLESSRPEKPQRPARSAQPSRQEIIGNPALNASRDHSPAVPSRLREEPVRKQPNISVRAGLSKQAAEEQASQAYVSSARRRKPQTVADAFTPEGDLLGGSTSATTARPAQAMQVKKSVASKPIETRPPPPKRNIPSISTISLKASHSDREAGNEYFKRGDYASASQSYTRSLSHIPTSHPITIILLTNRALVAIKIGEPKSAVADADAAIKVIGPSKGELETVDLSNGDTPKPMREYYGKALMRKAEALEHLEKWAEAAAVWREAVESGHGGSTAIQGRMRAEKAAAPAVARPKPAQSQKPPVVPRLRPKANGGVQAEAAAVSRLRAQNAAADKLDDEKFALSDSVDARLNEWKGGKQDNLRALLGSLDIVLWPEAGWKKISMADLVLPNKVKIQYMKGIAKVHPDKIPTNATTEQRMIAGAVFSTLNEAWDKFKKENGL